MVFSSIPFIFLFFPIFALFYYLVPFKAKNYVLLVFSLMFYAWGEPIYIILMLLITLVNYAAGLFLDRWQNGVIKRRIVLWIALVFSIGALGYFKYADFLIGIVNAIFRTDIGELQVRLPIGISFFTFQTLSYTIDLYKKEIKVEKNYAFFLMYVSMFPQLIAGPIVRFSTVQEELRKREITFQGFCDGLFRFCLGFFKKVLIANQMGLLWEAFNISDISNLSVMGAWLGLLAFTLQLYFDFSAYSDMAIGMGNMMGFHFLENFNYPLSAVSVTDFWRRWHISMSTWFRDYIYIPLGGNKGKGIINIRNLFIVWFTTGLWHGASWNFVLWGMFHLLFLVMEKNIYIKVFTKLPVFIRNIYTIIVVVLGFGIFAITDFSKMGRYFASVFGLNHNSLIDSEFLYYLNNFKIVLIAALMLSFPIYPYIKKKLYESENKVFRLGVQLGFAVVFLLCFVAGVSTLVADSYNPFLYFRF